LKVFKPDSNSKRKSIDEWNKRIDEIEKLIRKEEEGKQQTVSERRYQMMKEALYFHDSSWLARGMNRYDGYGCNHFTGCIPECRFYPKEGSIEDEEVLGMNKENDGESGASIHTKHQQ
jgi:hypothetical protein